MHAGSKRDGRKRAGFTLIELLVVIGIIAILIAILIGFDVTGVDERMTVFDAFAHALATLPTGGFGTDATSLEEFAPATHWAIAPPIECPTRTALAICSESRRLTTSFT